MARTRSLRGGATCNGIDSRDVSRQTEYMACIEGQGGGKRRRTRRVRKSRKTKRARKSRRTRRRRRN